MIVRKPIRYHPYITSSLLGCHHIVIFLHRPTKLLLRCSLACPLCIETYWYKPLFPLLSDFKLSFWRNCMLVLWQMVNNIYHFVWKQGAKLIFRLKNIFLLAPPPPLWLSSMVIFWPTPTHPIPWWRNIWMIPKVQLNVLKTSYFSEGPD